MICYHYEHGKCFFFCFNTGVLKDVQSYYSIDNSDAGLIQTSFICTYMVFSPVFGYLGDRYTRKYLMAGGIFLWSGFTITASFIPSDVSMAPIIACTGCCYRMFNHSQRSAKCHTNTSDNDLEGSGQTVTQVAFFSQSNLKCHN